MPFLPFLAASGAWASPDGDAGATQFHLFAEALPNHVWTAPPDGLIDWFNERVYEYTGAARGELDGMAWTRVVHPDDLPLAAERWSGALATGGDYEVEFRLQRVDGDYRWHLARALPLRAADGTIARWIGTNTDIHERKLAEAASTRDRNRIWTLSQELMLACDFDGVIADVNPSALRLLGWRPEQMIDRPIAAFLHPDDVERTAREVAKLSTGARTLAFENRYRTVDGSYRLLDWTAVPDGGFIHAVARDITRERATSKERERIWTSTNDLMAAVGVDGRLRSINPAWSRLLGHAEADILSGRFSDFVESDDRDRFEHERQRIGAGEAIGDFELRLVHKDGRRSLISWAVQPAGDVFYVVGRNVTEQRAAEDALRQSQKMEAVGQLTGGIAHDFNNLLQAISGSLELVQKRIAQNRLTELDRFVDRAMASARRAASLTHRLLAFSRRQPLDPRPVQVNPLIASMEDLLRRTLGEGIRFETALAPDVGLTKCDPNQLESAILNLTINARDAMPGGGVLTIATANATLDAADAVRDVEARPGRYVCISVADTGTGMSADTIAKAFEPFFTTKPMGQGTGLGLSMIYGFARQSEGHARIDSEVGRGTTFRLYLPRHQGDGEPEAPTDDALPELSAAHHAADHETVLVVEDEADIRALIVEVLTDLHYVALEAADGPAGLELLRPGRRIDLLVTDIGLPGLNGNQVVAAARRLRPELKVLFMTGYAENAALAAGFLEPGMSMITKPFTMEAMARRIREIIEGG